MEGVPGCASIIYFYVVECANCTKVLNKPIKVFLLHASYAALVIQKMARLSWKHYTYYDYYNTPPNNVALMIY